MSTPTPDAAAGADDAIRDALGQLAPDAGSPATDPAATPAENENDGTDELGDAGKQALDRMKAKWQAERAKRIAAEQIAATANNTDETERVRRDAEIAATTKANGRIVRAEIRALAAGRFADPADAVVFLDVSRFDVDDDGEVDRDEIAAAIDELLARKPHLGKTDTAAQSGARAPRPDRSQGAGEPGTPTTAQQFASAMRDRL